MISKGIVFSVMAFPNKSRCSLSHVEQRYAGCGDQIGDVGCLFLRSGFVQQTAYTLAG